MSPPLRDRLRAVIPALFAAQEEFMQIRYGTSADQRLGPPCTEEQVRQLEQELHCSLPPSYHQFLLLHDGWLNFSGEAHLLAISQRREPAIVGRIRDFLSLRREQAGSAAREPLVIVAGEGSTYIVYLDSSVCRPGGELDVVEYGYEEGEISRRPDLAAFLEDHLATVRTLIAEEKGELDEDSEAP
jgi:hypothetical protein